MAWAAGKKQDANAKLQLLKADPTTQSKLTATPSRKRYLTELFKLSYRNYAPIYLLMVTQLYIVKSVIILFGNVFFFS